MVATWCRDLQGRDELLREGLVKYIHERSMARLESRGLVQDPQLPEDGAEEAPAAWSK